MEATATVAQTTPTAQGTAGDGIVKVTTRGPITVDKVYTPEWAKNGELVAQLRQQVVTTTSYPSKKVSNNMQDNIFGLDEFGFEMKDYENTETRIAWIPVPPNSTKESVQARLDAAKSMLYKVLSNAPILTDDQKWAIENGLQYYSNYAANQIVRFPADHAETPEQIILHNGKVQYRRCFFTTDLTKADVDGRGADVVEYRSPEIVMELQGLNANAIQNVGGIPAATAETATA